METEAEAWRRRKKDQALEEMTGRRGKQRLRGRHRDRGGEGGKWLWLRRPWSPGVPITGSAGAESPDASAGWAPSSAVTLGK